MKARKNMKTVWVAVIKYTDNKVDKLVGFTMSKRDEFEISYDWKSGKVEVIVLRNVKKISMFQVTKKRAKEIRKNKAKKSEMDELIPE